MMPAKTLKTVGSKEMKHSGVMRTATVSRPVAMLFVAAIAALSGCSSSSSSKPQVVSIAVTDANGNVQSTPLSSLTVNTGVYLDVTLSGDSSGLGSDWTVACGSSLAPGTPLPPGETVSTVCGTFTPVHTLSAPVPNYVSNGAGYVTLYTAPAAPPQGGIVTLYAAATADPSRFASLSFPVLGLPVSVGFAPQPPASLAAGATTPLKAVVNDDYTPKGVTWSVICGAGAGAGACGSFNPVQTASGVATTYTAPLTVPAGGTVTVTATSVTDSTKSASGTITIAPIAVSVVPATLSVATGGTGLLNATVTNDVSNAGVDWSVTCAASGACGTITAHTASGAASTYTAPATVPEGGTVTVTATSTADKTAMGMSSVTVTATATPSVSGRVHAGAGAIAGAAVSLYAAGEAGYGSAAMLLNDKTAVSTDAEGRFTVASDKACPDAERLLYVVARGGDAGGGANVSIGLVAALGSCNQVASAKVPVVLNEATTVSAAFALANFMRDAGHIGSPASDSAGWKRAGMTNAFATANAIVDVATGEVRTLTPTGEGAIPQAEVNMLANVLNRCVASAADSAACRALFSQTKLAEGADTLQAAVSIARGGNAGLPAAQIFELSSGFEAGPFQPSLGAAPEDWMLRISYPASSVSLVRALPASLSRDAATVDSAGDEWLLNRDGSGTEIVGAMPPRVP